ncbi:hypothetical protein A5746_12935 [Mycolicibacterium conceptionense]|uniref:DUF5663 domain-containing protein n=1 Tax=Mycolicibacterium conceptionense TaxID=451644 RepID=UPI0007EDFA64|nr:DUF5663 domain-containing protein [Mycolicibacterium conceptionense]OBJ98351.1 hypothetical protein A5639_29510 [Mycolicibacterium conceptionense]OMB86011.1 hypothetical protein A5741_18145 [Mycolicibacterium conceptionense]OMB99984.1 hypothetical protein A5746_12935 [Mycolicibacterium conceptionense]
MIQLDDAFLAEAGLSGLPDADKQQLLEVVYSELELRVGTALAHGLSGGQRDEFSAVMDRDHQRIVSWLEANAPDFLDDPVYQRMADALAGREQAEIMCEYVSVKWLDLNRPNYRDIVQSVLVELQTELRADADRLLSRVRSGSCPSNV